ncbi:MULTISPECIES: methionyl-tRNA formyltransferase [unclassified Bradyrhizobium]|uniref:methionyl-tRNA formyltransferase n=1 Tax=unclassified Bradyrhizobium TaxID=2631580 RepID=UPI0029169256|nr:MULTISPECIES: formyltransferase family protein [unclassified Bradyrhizobium]
MLALHPSHALTTVGYADVLHAHGPRFEIADYFHSTKSDRFSALVLEARLDFLLVISLSQLIPQQLVDCHSEWHLEEGSRIYKRACVGAHPSPLPSGRGRAPIPWTIINDLRTSALTIFALDQGTDDGPVIQQSEFYIDVNDDAASLYERVRYLHRSAGHALAKPLSAGVLVAKPQDHARATVWERRAPADGYISSAYSADYICKLVRAGRPPYPLPFIVIGETRIDVSDAWPILIDEETPPGTILKLTSEYIDLQLAIGAVRLVFAFSLESEIPLALLSNLVIP